MEIIKKNSQKKNYTCAHSFDDIHVLFLTSNY